MTRTLTTVCVGLTVSSLARGGPVLLSGAVLSRRGCSFQAFPGVCVSRAVHLLDFESSLGKALALSVAEGLPSVSMYDCV